MKQSSRLAHATPEVRKLQEALKSDPLVKSDPARRALYTKEMRVRRRVLRRPRRAANACASRALGRP